MNDKEFDDMLRSEPAVPELPADFRREVWTRIAHEGRKSQSAVWRRFLVFWGRPVPAMLGVASTVAIGLALGLAGAPSEKDVRLSYARSISPFDHGEAP